MKVKELIARLQTLDPEYDILADYDDGYELNEPIPVLVSDYMCMCDKYSYVMCDHDRTFVFPNRSVGPDYKEEWYKAGCPDEWTDELEERTGAYLRPCDIAILRADKMQLESIAPKL